jgi:hypothetical protein
VNRVQAVHAPQKPGEHGCMRWERPGGSGSRVLEDGSLRRNPIEGRRSVPEGIVASESIGAQGVERDEDDVPLHGVRGLVAEHHGIAPYGERGHVPPRVATRFRRPG